MEKTIKIGNKNVRLNNNVSWTIEYRDQFGHDILPTIMPALASILDIVSGVINSTGKIDKIEVEEVLKAINGDTLTDAMIHLSGLEFVDLFNIVWALAKAADEDIPDPKTWAKSLEYFPVDVVAPPVFELVFKGMVSSKNWKRLMSLKGSLTSQPLTSTPSSSQDSNED